MRSYLHKTDKLPFAGAVNITMQAEAMRSLKIVLYTCVQALLNAELVSLKSGEGIL